MGHILGRPYYEPLLCFMIFCNLTTLGFINSKLPLTWNQAYKHNIPYIAIGFEHNNFTLADFKTQQL